MQALWAICRRDLIQFFSTPLAWLVLACWAFLANGAFYVGDLGAAHGQEMTHQPLFVTSLSLSMWWLMFLAPALTMNSFAAERVHGTMQLLLTVPVKDWHLILGKFLAVWIMLLTLIAATLVQPLVLVFVSDPGGFQLLAGYFGMVLMCGLLSAIGIWISLLVDSPVAAYVITFACLAVLLLTGFLSGNKNDVMSSIGDHISILNRMQDMIHGKISLGTLLYFIGGTSIFLVLAHGILAVRRTHG